MRLAVSWAEPLINPAHGVLFNGVRPKAHLHGMCIACASGVSRCF